jgi:hypothetical protein
MYPELNPVPRDEEPAPNGLTYDSLPVEETVMSVMVSIATHSFINRRKPAHRIGN